MNKSQEYLNNLRHSCAHLLAAAVMELWPDTKRTIGPAIENGFYFDFEFKKPISETDLTKIEQRMHQIVKTWVSFERHELSPVRAKKEYPNNPYKHELIDEFSKKGQKLTFYKSGNYWDLCRGGHVDSKVHLKGVLQHFRLLSIAGAYWRGDEKNKMLTRIYGTCFQTKEELEKYIWQQAEAKKRDHRKIGEKLELFALSDKVGPGLILWLPKGTIIKDELEKFAKKTEKEWGYVRVSTPVITKSGLYYTSGHLPYYKKDMYPPMKLDDKEEYYLKPMNCPHHTQIYARHPHSYRDLPQRYANTTTCYRDEQSGELNGLSRTRAFAQDDAHVFCRIEQAKDEIQKIWEIVHVFYESFGLNLELRLSLRDPSTPEKYLGNQELWDKAEKILRGIAGENKTKYVEAPGEAAFYAPKLDFMTKDSLSREWQVATIQLDVNMPERFDLTCVNERGDKERIVMIHAAIMGSLERFMSILLEHTQGTFPLWLSPIQVKILPIGEAHFEYAKNVFEKLKAENIRTELDDSNESLGKKIRNAKIEKTPYMLVIGDKEVSEDKVTLESRDSGNLGQLGVEELISKLKVEIKERK